MADGVELAKTYLTVVPTMRGMKDALRGELKAVDGKSAGRRIGEEMSDGAGRSFDLSGITGKLAGAAKAVAGAVAASAAGVAAIGKQALDSYASYEQLAGGVETLFGARGAQSVEEYAAMVGKSVDEVAGEYDRLMSSQATVMENASAAFKTAGMSANEYMETVTSFSASLLQSLGGDTEAAASMADMAIVDMADNANKMGSSLESIQNAYQGFAKQNYTMLDNLKLGYGGTKSEMERLLADAEALSGVHYDLESYADIVQAIHVIQDEMGITGTTSKEAATTIEGSLNSMKAAYSNLLTGLMDDNADLGGLIDDLVGSAETFASNVMPVVAKFAERVVQALPRLFEMVAGKLPELAGPLLDAGLNALVGLLHAVEGMFESLDTVAMRDSLREKVSEAIGQIVPAVTSLLPYLLDFGMQLMLGIAGGLADALPDVIENLADVIMVMVGLLADYLPEFVMVGMELLIALAEGLGRAVPKMVERLPEVLERLRDAFEDAIPDMVDLGKELVNAIVEGILSIGDSIWKTLSGLVGDAFGGFMDFITGGGTISPVEVPAFASGGYVDSPTLAMVGEGGHGEYMVPGNYIGALASEISGRIAGDGLSVYVTVEARDGEDAYELGRRVGDATAYELRLQGVAA